MRAGQSSARDGTIIPVKLTKRIGENLWIYEKL